MRRTKTTKAGEEIESDTSRTVDDDPERWMRLMIECIVGAFVCV